MSRLEQGFSNSAAQWVPDELKNTQLGGAQGEGMGEADIPSVLYGDFAVIVTILYFAYERLSKYLMVTQLVSGRRGSTQCPLI